MNNIVIDRHFDKKMEKQYVKIPFEIPSETEILECSYRYENSDRISYAQIDKSIIEIGLIDEKGDDIGSSGCSKSSVTVSARYSTVGFKRIEPKGRWTLVFGLFSVKSTGVDVHCEIKFTKKERRLFIGDTHLHTTSSDGSKDVNKLCKFARRNNLEFAIITDHNNFAENINLPSFPDMTVIPGIEMTNYKGHLNIWGVKKPYEGSFSFDKFEDLKKLNDMAYKNGAVQSVNHPFAYQFEWKWGFENLKYDCVEIWNTLMRKDNLTAVEWWNGELIKGKKIPVVGGSDFHKRFGGLNLLGRPSTAVISNSSSPEDILDAIKNGHSIIIKSPKCSVIKLTSDDNIVGDTVNWSEKSTVRIMTDRLKKGHILRVIDNTGVIYETQAKKTHSVDIVLPVKNKGFVRVEILYKMPPFEKFVHHIYAKLMCPDELKTITEYFINSITNPIYFE